MVGVPVLLLLLLLLLWPLLLLLLLPLVRAGGLLLSPPPGPPYHAPTGEYWPSWPGNTAAEAGTPIMKMTMGTCHQYIIIYKEVNMELLTTS